MAGAGAYGSEASELGRLAARLERDEQARGDPKRAALDVEALGRAALAYFDQRAVMDRCEARGLMFSTARDLRDQAAREIADQVGPLLSHLAGMSDELAALSHPLDAGFLEAVPHEAAYQRARWSEHDPEKTPADWYWLVGWLLAKAIHREDGGAAKRRHRLVAAAAAILNWHATVEDDGGEPETGNR